MSLSQILSFQSISKQLQPEEKAKGPVAAAVAAAPETIYNFRHTKRRTLTKEDEEMSKSALSTFRAKEEEIEKKKLEVKERVQAQLGRIEEETKRLATIREEREYKEALDAFNEKNKETYS